MPAKQANVLAFQEAVERLVNRLHKVAPDDQLTDANLIKEAGISKATFYRCNVEKWKEAKQKSVLDAIEYLRKHQRSNPGTELLDRDLFKQSRVDHAAFHKMPHEVIDLWGAVKLHKPAKSRREQIGYNADDAIERLASKLYGLQLALRHAHEIIGAQNKEITRLGGNVINLSNRKSVAERGKSRNQRSD